MTAQRHQSVEGGDCPAFLCAGVALPCVLGAAIKERHKILTEHPEEGYKDVEGCRGEAV